MSKKVRHLTRSNKVKVQRVLDHVSCLRDAGIDAGHSTRPGVLNLGNEEDDPSETYFVGFEGGTYRCLHLCAKGYVVASEDMDEYKEPYRGLSQNRAVETWVASVREVIPEDLEALEPDTPEEDE